MKVFISADIEGIATTTINSDCNPTSSTYSYHCEQMTSEVIAACEGALNAGAKEIVVRDAHGPATNIDIKRLPKQVKVIREWSGHPYSMVEGIDNSYDACMFIGYHNAASRNGNPLSHTISGKPFWIKLNGRITSEFLMFSYAAANEGVPTVFLSGDKQLCDDYADLHPQLVTAAVKEGYGARTLSVHPATACDMLREGTEKALSQNLKTALIELPKKFDVEICYRSHMHATEYSYYPGAKLISDTNITFSSNDYFEVMRFFQFVL